MLVYLKENTKYISKKLHIIVFSFCTKGKTYQVLFKSKDIYIL